MAYGSVNVPGVTQADLLEVRRKGGYYGVCDTSSNIAAKTVSVDNTFALESGVEVTVKFSYTHKGSAPTLNVNKTGTKSIYYKGAHLPASIELPSGWYYNIQAGGIYTFRYNTLTSCWELVGELYNPIAPAALVASSLTTGLDIQLNGTSQGEWNGNTDKTVNITPSGIGTAEYEEGEWTPIVYIDGDTFATETCIATYEKIGKRVFLDANMSFGYSTYPSNTYAVSIKNLPFLIMGNGEVLIGRAEGNNPSNYYRSEYIKNYSSNILIYFDVKVSITTLKFHAVYEIIN